MISNFSPVEASKTLKFNDQPKNFTTIIDIFENCYLIIDGHMANMDTQNFTMASAVDQVGIEKCANFNGSAISAQNFFRLKVHSFRLEKILSFCF